MLHKKIIKIRQELVDFISECAVDRTALINKISNLPDDEILELYIQNTFYTDWRGELIEHL